MPDAARRCTGARRGERAAPGAGVYFWTLVTSVGRSHGPPAETSRHRPELDTAVRTNAVPFQAQLAVYQQSPRPRPLWPSSMVTVSSATAEVVTSVGWYGARSLTTQ